MAKYDFQAALNLGNQIQGYARELNNADRIRLASFLLGLVNSVQQTAKISQDAMWHAQKTTDLFHDVDMDMDANYHLHNMLSDLADDFDELADQLADEDEEAIVQQEARDAALAKLTDAEKILLGLPV